MGGEAAEESNLTRFSGEFRRIALLPPHSLTTGGIEMFIGLAELARLLLNWIVRAWESPSPILILPFRPEDSH